MLNAPIAKKSQTRAHRVPAVLLNYFRAQLYKAIVFVLVAFVGLFAFFDLIGELDRLSMPGTSWWFYTLAVFLGLPARVYEIAPIAALIGTIYALVQIAASSEFTAMRAAGLSTWGMLKMLLRIGLGVAILTVLFGEVIAPIAERVAVPMRARALGHEVGKEFQSGYWLRDVWKAGANDTRIRYVNFDEFSADGFLVKLEFYEMDDHSRIRRWVRAERAEHDGDSGWILKQVREQVFFEGLENNPQAQAAGVTIQASPIQTHEDMRWDSHLSPVMLTGLFVEPDRMSAWQLYNYARFLKSNQQNAENIDLAFAKKLMYPVAILIMMVIALPFAYLHFRSGGVSVKIFVGIMIGVAFHLINNLFAHLGLVARLPPAISAGMPSLLGFVGGAFALWWVSQPAPWRLLERWRLDRLNAVEKAQSNSSHGYK